jgi:hypothetical protein
MHDLSRFLADCIETCIAQGMTFPILLVAVGVNGAVMAARYTPSPAGDSLDFTTVVEAKAKLKLPINVMICDRSGWAARSVIIREGARLLH